MIGANLDKNYHLFYLKYLIEIFKLVYPEYFEYNPLGCKKNVSFRGVIGFEYVG